MALRHRLPRRPTTWHTAVWAGRLACCGIFYPDHATPQFMQAAEAGINTHSAGRRRRAAAAPVACGVSAGIGTLHGPALAILLPGLEQSKLTPRRWGTSGPRNANGGPEACTGVTGLRQEGS